MAIATFAAGCFWGVQSRLDKIEGVSSTEVGYTGGSAPHPSYEQVCSHTTGHAEAVRLEYDPEIVTYDQLLHEFFDLHDPTQLDRQGPDVGDQYRSAIYFHTPQQEEAARAAVDRLTTERRFKRPIVTRIEPAPDWWRAEGYHQKYFEKRGLASCPI
jgi:peptide-methionine (S)-S-oxide reductase